MMNYYMTEYGPVCVSKAEAEILSTAVMVKTHYARTSLFSRPNASARTVVEKAEAIRAACERFAMYKLELNQD